MLGSNMYKLEKARNDMLMNEVTVYVDMLGSSMGNGVACQQDC